MPGYLILEFWDGSAEPVLTVTAPLGYPCPRVGEHVKSSSGALFKVLGVSHQFDLFQKDFGEAHAPAFTVRILVNPVAS